VLEGRYNWNRRNDAGYQRAEEAFNQAIQLDPGYAEAYSALSGMIVVREDDRLISGLAPNPAESKRSRAMAQRALELDPAMAEAHGSLGLGLRQQGRLQEAQVEFETALTLNPGDVKMHSWYGTHLLLRGRLDEGMSEWEKTLGLDPLYVISLLSYPRSLVFLGRYEEALKFYDRVAVLLPGYSIPNSAQRARALWGMGRKEEALAEARSVRSHRELKNRLAGDAVAIYVLREAGLADEAAEYAEESLKRYPVDSYLRGFVLTALGRFDEALPFLERTPVTMNQVLFWDAMWDRWRDDPRFGQLMEKLACAEEYKTARATFARMQSEATR
jgi:tetratricopeptide (TPR) repeat protein